MNPVDFIIRFRTQIFIVLIFLEITFSICAYSYRLTSTRMFFISETFTTLAIIILSFILLDKFNLFSDLASKRQTMLDSSPANCIFYDLETHTISASLASISLLNLPKKPEYKTADISSLFANAEWREIEKLIKEPASYINIEKIGEFKILDKEGYPTFIKYQIQVIRERELDMYGIMFWFFDFTETKMIQEEFQNYLSKYREISFSQDLLLNSLKTPICLTNTEKKSIIYNDLYAHLLDLDPGLKSKELKTKIMNKNKKIDNDLVIHSKDLNKHFHIKKSTLNNNLGELIIARDNSLEYDLNKEIRNLNSAFEEIVELSNGAIMLIDDDTYITNFNHKILDIYDLDEAWLKDRPTFAEFLDKLKQHDKIPESVDFINYKRDMLKYLSDNNPHVDFLHQTEGNTLKISLLPCKDGGKIYVCEDISDVLSIERSYNQIKLVLNEVISAFENPVLVIGYDGIVKQFNSCTLSFFKINNIEDLANHHYSNFLKQISDNSNDIKNISTKLTSCLENRLNQNITMALPNNDNIYIQVTSLPDNSILVSFKSA